MEEAKLGGGGWVFRKITNLASYSYAFDLLLQYKFGTKVFFTPSEPTKLAERALAPKISKTGTVNSQNNGCWRCSYSKFFAFL
jgi:hypothetical protein